MPGLDLLPAIPDTFEFTNEEIKFDPKKHLQIELPSSCKSMEFKDLPFPYAESIKKEFPGFAYSAPFRILSDEGTKVFRSVIDANEKYAKGNERIPKCLRGLGYRSQLIRDLTFCPELLDVMSQMCNKPIYPHTMGMNIGHTNFSIPGSKAPVDQWHTDSVDYVLIIILSDTTDMEGGKLNVVQYPDCSDSAGGLFHKLKTEGVPEDLMETVEYPGAGFAIFMQGSKILHRVTAVTSAKEPRISYVNSYVSRDVFDEDKTRFQTFKHQDPEHVTFVEFARHKAWRIHGQLDYVMNETHWGQDRFEIAQYLENAANELLRASRLLTDKEDDRLGFIPHKEGDDKPKSPKATM
jgi:hypothetical protein